MIAYILKQEKHLSLERLDSIVYISQVRPKFGGCIVVQRDSLTNRYVDQNKLRQRIIYGPLEMSGSLTPELH